MEFWIFKMSWTKPKFEKLGPMPVGIQGGERQGSNADTEGDVELPPLPKDFENEENTSPEDDKNSGDNSGSGGSESRGLSDGSFGSAYSSHSSREPSGSGSF